MENSNQIMLALGVLRARSMPCSPSRKAKMKPWKSMIDESESLSKVALGSLEHPQSLVLQSLSL